jgi:hypothetical protein
MYPSAGARAMACSARCRRRQVGRRHHRLAGARCDIDWPMRRAMISCRQRGQKRLLIERDG